MYSSQTKGDMYHNLTNVIFKEYFILIFLIGMRFKKSFPLFALGSSMSTFVQKVDSDIQWIKPGADPGFFLGGGALVSCSTSTPINHIVSFLAEYQLY